MVFHPLIRPCLRASVWDLFFLARLFVFVVGVFLFLPFSSQHLELFSSLRKMVSSCDQIWSTKSWNRRKEKKSGKKNSEDLHWFFKKQRESFHVILNWQIKIQLFDIYIVWFGHYLFWTMFPRAKNSIHKIEGSIHDVNKLIPNQRTSKQSFVLWPTGCSSQT